MPNHEQVSELISFADFPLRCVYVYMIQLNLTLIPFTCGGERNNLISPSVVGISTIVIDTMLVVPLLSCNQIQIFNQISGAWENCWRAFRVCVFPDGLELRIGAWRGGNCKRISLRFTATVMQISLKAFYDWIIFEYKLTEKFIFKVSASSLNFFCKKLFLEFF